MNGFTVGYFNGILHAFTDGWMRMDTVQHFMVGSFQFAGHHGFGNQFGYIIPDHMGTQPFTLFCVEDHFYKTLRMSCG